MGKLIDADVLMTWFKDNYDDEDVSVEYVSGIIEEQPEAIIRCKDCKYFSVVKANIGILVEGCYFLKELSKYLVPRPHVYPVLTCADGYCSWGERRTDGTD